VKTPQVRKKFGEKLGGIFSSRPTRALCSKGSLFCEKADEFLSVGDEENHGYLIFSD
jgi:hypothetical protein